MMLVPERPSPTLTDGVCGVSDCDHTPSVLAVLAAQALGYAWETRDPLPGLEPAFFICPACVQEQAVAALRENVEAGYAQALTA